MSLFNIGSLLQIRQQASQAKRFAQRLSAEGFMQVPIKNTKNFKWVKNYPTTNTLNNPIYTENLSSTVILPTGTKVHTFVNGNMRIEKANGDIVQRFANPNGTYDITKTTNGIFEVLREGVVSKARNALNARRQAFIDGFNAKFSRKTIEGKNGAKTKIISDKETGKTVSWWRKNEKGEITSGRIDYPLFGMEKSTTIKNNDGYTIKSVFPNPEIEIPGVNIKAVSTTKLDPNYNLLSKVDEVRPK